MLRRRLLDNSEAGGGYPHTLNLRFSGTGPIDTSAWKDLEYRIEDINGKVILDDILMETYRSCDVESGTYYIVPKGYLVDRTLYNGSTLYIYFNDAKGNPIMNNPPGTIQVSARPGGYDLSYLVGNNSQFIEIIVNDDINVGSEEGARLVCNPSITIGDFYFQFYLYV